MKIKLIILIILTLSTISCNESNQQKNPKETSKIPLRYFAYGFGVIEPMIFKTQLEFLQTIKKWGFSINPICKIVKNLNEIEKGSNTYKGLKKDFIKVEWLPDRLIHTDNEVIE